MMPTLATVQIIMPVNADPATSVIVPRPLSTALITRTKLSAWCQPGQCAPPLPSSIRFAPLAQTANLPELYIIHTPLPQVSSPSSPGVPAQYLGAVPRLRILSGTTNRIYVAEDDQKGRGTDTERRQAIMEWLCWSIIEHLFRICREELAESITRTRIEVYGLEWMWSRRRRTRGQAKEKLASAFGIMVSQLMAMGHVNGGPFPGDWSGPVTFGTASEAPPCPACGAMC